MAKTISERQTELRARRQASGLKRVELWIHPDDSEQLRKLADRLNSKREKGKAVGD
jgi:hypothetical protein